MRVPVTPWTRWTCVIAILAALLVSGATTAWAQGGAADRGAGVRPGGAARVGAGGALGERRERLDELGLLGRQPSSAPAPVAVARAPRAAPSAPRRSGSLVTLHHGSVHLGAGLARVDLTLEVQNVGPQTVEWRRTYAMDPVAEVIGAVLERVNEDPIVARTLTLPDARRIYAEVVTPPPSRRPTRAPRNRDPLRIERPQRDRLDIAIWPIAPNEIVRVRLTFVTPLRGQGARRTYEDVMGGPASRDAPRLDQPSQQNPTPTRPDSFVSAEADWLVDPGTLVLSSVEPIGMTLKGEAAGRLHFTGAAAVGPETSRACVGFLTTSRERTAHIVQRAGIGGRLATWRFDPREFLTSRGFELRHDLRVRLVEHKGFTRRIAPHEFRATDQARPVTARIIRDLKNVHYTVEVVDREGVIIESYDQEIPAVADDLHPKMVGAVSGWHRAALVKRVFAWAGSDARQRRRAQSFAVDMGVLVPGTAALALPSAERRRLSAASRRVYDNDGVPLGAQHREADTKVPPKGALK